MADVAATLSQWSTTASSNAPADSTAIGSGLGDNLRTLQAVVATYLAAYNGSAIASAGTCAIGGVAGLFVEISGTNAITAFGNPASGSPWKIVRFQDALTLTHNAVSLILPGGANITTAAGDYCLAFHRGSGNWTVPFYQRASGAPPKEDWTILDAKGDLIIATAADTPAKHAVGNNGTLLMADSANADGWRNWVPRNYISGLMVTNNAGDVNNDLDISVGECTDDTQAYMMRLTGALTKQFDNPWAAGTGAGGMAAGETKGNGSIIHVWLIGKTDGTIDVMGNDHVTSGLSPALPAGYTIKRLIGTRLTYPATANFATINVVELAGGGEEIEKLAPTDFDVNVDDTLTTTERLDVIRVPLGYKVKAKIRVRALDNTTAFTYWVQNPDVLSSAPGANPPLASGQNAGAVTGQADYRELEIWTDTSGQIMSRASLATVDEFRVIALSWQWSRRL